MKELKITIHEFAEQINNTSITSIRSVNLIQIFLVIPYTAMFYFLYSNSNAVNNTPGHYYMYSLGNIIMFPFYLAAVKHIFNNVLHKVDYPKIYFIYKKVPFYSNKSITEMYILEIQKAYNLFFALLDLYSLIGIIILIKIIKNGIIYSNIHLWLNIIPFLCTVIIALYKYPTRESIIKTFNKYIVDYS